MKIDIVFRDGTTVTHVWVSGFLLHNGFLKVEVRDDKNRIVEFGYAADTVLKYAWGA